MGGRIIGDRSLLIPILDLKFPTMCPKSMWNSFPQVCSIILSLCLEHDTLLPRKNNNISITGLNFNQLEHAEQCKYRIYKEKRDGSPNE